MFVEILLHDIGYQFRQHGGGETILAKSRVRGNRKHFLITNEFAANLVADYFRAEQLADPTKAPKDFEKLFRGAVPDEIFQKKIDELGSPTVAWMDIYRNRYPELEEYLIKIIDAELKRRGEEKVEAILNFQTAFASVRHLGKLYNCPIISFESSAVRVPHGYVPKNLWITNFGGILHTADEAAARYQKFLAEGENPIFSKREILVIIGKKRNFPLLKYLDCQPKYEIGNCGSLFKLLAPFSFSNQITDDDIGFRCHKKFSPAQIALRPHPLVAKQFRTARYMRSDPAAFVLSCKRLTSINSNTLIKALMWNRTAVMDKDAHIFSYLCEQDITSEKKISDKALSHFLFGILVPEPLHLDEKYWRWRINEKPSETEIYHKHLKFIFEKLGFDMEILKEPDEEKRFRYFLEKRVCDPDVMEQLLSGEKISDINFDVLNSRFVIGDEQDCIKEDLAMATPDEIRKFIKCAVDGKIIDAVNSFRDGKVFTSHKITVDKNCSRIIFFPFLDLEADAKINSVVLDGKILHFSSEGEYIRFHKFKGFSMSVDLPAGKHEISVEWEYKLVI